LKPPWQRPLSTTARVAALSFLALALSSALVLGFAARLTVHALDNELGELTRGEAREIAATFAREGPAAAAMLIDAELRQSRQLVIRLERADGRALAGNAQAWPPTLTAPSRWREMQLYVAAASEPKLYGVVTLRLADGYRLLVGRDVAERERIVRLFSDAALGALALALLLAIGGALALSRLIAGRVRTVAEAALAVAAGDLSRRVARSGSDDAFDVLAGALNSMLARIEALVGELRLVTDSLAHDLRSPIVRLKARIDGALAAGDGAVDPSVLIAVAAEADALLRMIAAALEISRAEAGIGRDGFASLDAAAAVREIVELYEPLGAERGVTITADAPTTPLATYGHRQLLSQALANLVDNALAHAPGAAIVVGAVGDAASIMLWVADDGPGIADHRRAEALRRFGRLDPARGATGAGLGLSLVAAIAHLHGGSLTLGNNNPGLRATLSFPATSQP